MPGRTKPTMRKGYVNVPRNNRVYGHAYRTWPMGRLNREYWNQRVYQGAAGTAQAWWGPLPKSKGKSRRR